MQQYHQVQEAAGKAQHTVSGLLLCVHQRGVGDAQAGRQAAARMSVWVWA